MEIFAKRSAFTASLPTPPRKYRRCKRECSHGDCDSESNDLGNQGPELSSTDEEDTQFQWLRTSGDEVSQRVTMKSWLAGVRDTISEGFGSGISRRKGLTLLTFRQLFHCCIATYEEVTFRG